MLVYILKYLPEVAARKEEETARWKEKPTATIFESAPTL